MFQVVERDETIAIPTWETRVAPRFGVADTFTIIGTGNDGSMERCLLQMRSHLRWNERLLLLKEAGVDVVICGGFNRRFLPLAHSMGLQVWPGVSGCVDDVVEQCRQGQTKVFQQIFQSGCTGRRRRRRAGCIH